MALEVNAVDCIQITTDFGVTHYHNICTGEVQHLAWGSFDWALVGGMALLILLIAAFFVSRLPPGVFEDRPALNSTTPGG